MMAARQKRIWLIAFGALTLTACLLYLYTAFREASDFSPLSVDAFLLVPKVIRQASPPQICSAISLGRHFQECGGICGARYSVEFQSMASEEEIQVWAENGVMGADERIDSFALISGDLAQDGCTEFTVAFVDDFEDER